MTTSWARAVWSGSFPGGALLRAGPRTARWVIGSLVRPRPPAPGAHYSPIPTPALVSEVVLDEVVRAAMVDLHRTPSKDDSRRMAADVHAAAALWQARGWDVDPASYHRDPPPVPADDVEWSRRRFPELHEHLAFPSRYEPRADEPGAERWSRAAEGDLVHAAVLRHGDGTDRPWLVCLHGFGMGWAMADLRAFRARHLHDELGLNVAVPVLPRHGPRRRRGASPLLSMDLVQSVHGLAQAAWDIRRLVRHLRSLSGQPVGLTGISLGGYTTALVASLEPLDLALAGIPAADFPDLLARHSPAAVATAAHRRGSLGPEADTVVSVVSPLAMPPQVPPDRRFIYAGMGDRLAPASHALRLWEHWERPTIRWYPGGHVGFVWSRPVRTFITDTLAASGFAQSPEGAPAPPLASDAMISLQAGHTG